MLRSRSAAGYARCHDVLVRVHVLPGLRRRSFERPLPELRRRTGAPPDSSRRQAREISGIHGTQAEAAGLRGGVTRTPLIPAQAGIQTLPPLPVALNSCLRGNERRYAALG